MHAAAAAGAAGAEGHRCESGGFSLLLLFVLGYIVKKIRLKTKVINC